MLLKKLPKHMSDITRLWFTKLKVFNCFVVVNNQQVCVDCVGSLIRSTEKGIGMKEFDSDIK